MIWRGAEAIRHALRPQHNWSKVIGTTTPTLADIKPYVDEVLKNGIWNKAGDAHGPGGKVMGEILEAEADVDGHTIWVRGFRHAAHGKIIVNNGGVR